MCRNIKTLFNFEPPASDDESPSFGAAIRAQAVRLQQPSHANQEAFNLAVEEVSAAAHKLLASLHTHAPARDREVEAEKAKERARVRFA